jgi:hypothetical protein
MRIKEKSWLLLAVGLASLSGSIVQAEPNGKHRTHWRSCFWNHVDREAFVHRARDWSDPSIWWPECPGPKPIDDPSPIDEPDPIDNPNPNPIEDPNPNPVEDPNPNPVPGDDGSIDVPDVPGLPDSYPDASTTGVPAGVVLTPSETLEISEPGTVIDGYEVNGIILVHASNVTIRNTRVVGTGYWSILVDDGLSGVVIEDSEIAGQETTHGTEGSNGIMGPATVQRCEITGVENGITPGAGSVIRDNYIHDLGAPGEDPHIDGIQIDGNLSNITIEHNRILSKDTSAVMIDNYFGPISHIVVTGNYLAGGAYTVYSDGQFEGGQISDVQFTYNRVEMGVYGYASIEYNTVVDIGNVDAFTGEPITLQ